MCAFAAVGKNTRSATGRVELAASSERVMRLRLKPIQFSRMPAANWVTLWRIMRK
jgi:hypothetical protein